MKISRLQIPFASGFASSATIKWFPGPGVASLRTNLQNRAFCAQVKSAREKYFPLHSWDRFVSGCLCNKRPDLFILSGSPICIGRSGCESPNRSAGVFSQFGNRRPAGKSERAEPPKNLLGCFVYRLSGRVLFFHALLAINPPNPSARWDPPRCAKAPTASCLIAPDGPSLACSPSNWKP